MPVRPFARLPTDWKVNSYACISDADVPALMSLRAVVYAQRRTLVLRTKPMLCYAHHP